MGKTLFHNPFNKLFKRVVFILFRVQFCFRPAGHPSHKHTDGASFSLVRSTPGREASIPLQSSGPCSIIHQLFSKEKPTHSPTKIQLQRSPRKSCSGLAPTQGPAMTPAFASYLAASLKSLEMGFGFHWFWHPFIQSFGSYIHKGLIKNAW